MYENFYGFKEKPFTMPPDPKFLYLSDRHSAALTMLEFGLVHQTIITVITGEVGSGKTTLISKLLNEITNEMNVGLISNTHNSCGDLIEWVLLAYGLPYKGIDKTEMYEVFINFLVEEYSANKRTMLIIDEAQNLNKDALEELRLLTNINSDDNVVLQLILVGQPELRDKLSSPELSQFVQRIGSECHLSALDMKETQSYIKHRLEMVGGDTKLFNPMAIVTIHYYSKGIPRLINTLCDISLVYAYAQELKKIDSDLVQRVVSDKFKNGLLPISPLLPRRAKLRTL